MPKILKLHDIPSPKYMGSAKQTIRALQRLYNVPRGVKIKYDPTLLKKTGALGLYYPQTETIVLDHDKIESPMDMFVLFIEWMHHAMPATHHDGE